jgi:hypothetical protein
MTDDDDLEEKFREIQNLLANPEVEERLHKALTDPSGPLFPPTFLRQFERWDDVYLKLIQSPTTPADVVTLAKKGREHLAEAMQAARRIMPPPIRASKRLRRRGYFRRTRRAGT